ncbi:MAG: MBL fold metallo-hydrolase [Patescibacteria group bacterium]
MKKLDNLSFLIVFGLVVLNLFVWFQIIFRAESKGTEFYFLDVGQGDGTLGVFQNGVKFLMDAGPGAQTVASLEKVLGRNQKYIDLAMITHPQLDHFGGFNYILEKYNVGAFVVNGREVVLPEWRELMEKIKEKEIPLMVLGVNDKIIFQNNSIDFLSPDNRQLQSAELNDGSLVGLVKTPEAKMLLTGDISFSIENYLIEKFGVEGLDADILKVPHHGSKYSSGEKFLDAVTPAVAVIEVGKNNYGHPTKEVLGRLESKEIKTFRTDTMGTLKIEFEGDKLQVFSL